MKENRKQNQSENRTCNNTHTEKDYADKEHTENSHKSENY